MQLCVKSVTDLDYAIGHYVITHADSIVHREPVHYGASIGNGNMGRGRFNVELIQEGGMTVFQVIDG